VPDGRDRVARREIARARLHETCVVRPVIHRILQLPIRICPLGLSRWRTMPRSAAFFGPPFSFRAPFSARAHLTASVASSCSIFVAPTAVPRLSRAQISQPRWRYISRAAATPGAGAGPPDEAPSDVPLASLSDLERRRNGPLARLRGTVAPSAIDRSIAKIALPALGTLALEPLVALCDMAVVGLLGSAALGGVGVSNNVFNLSFTCFNFLGLATCPAIAAAYGRGDTDEASRLVAQALWVAAFFGCLAMAFLFRFTVPIVTFFGANAAIAPSATSYLRARIVAAPFFLSSMVANGAFRGFQDTKTPLFVGLISNIINLTLFPTLIFGLGMGITGAGVATAVGQIFAGTCLFALLVKEKRLKLSDLRTIPSPARILPLLRSGCILSVRTLSIFTTISYATATAAKLGTTQVAAFEIGRQIFALFARLLDAISVAAQSLVALALGQSNERRARHISNRILQLGVGLGCLFAVILMAGLNVVPGIFTSDPLVRAAVTRTFPLMAIVQPINGLVFVYDGIFTAGRRFTLLSAGIFCAAALSMATLYYVRHYALSLPAVWIGLNVMMLFRAGLLGIGYMSKWSPVPRLTRTPKRVKTT
jgi:putative MATE family efflux protein